MASPGSAQSSWGGGDPGVNPLVRASGKGKRYHYLRHPCAGPVRGHANADPTATVNRRLYGVV